MSGYRELLLGCGASRVKKIVPPGSTSTWQALTTADINSKCSPDWLLDMDRPQWVIRDPAITLPAQVFDEVHAYEVLEHLGTQGDVRAFFGTFNNIGFLMKVGGVLCATTPSRFSPWLWGDPGHRRVILPQSLVFLSRRMMAAQPKASPASDYSGFSRYDWDIERSEDDRECHRFVLRKVSE